MPYFPFFTQTTFGNRPHFGWIWLLTLVVIWGLFWKGMALWRAAKSDQKNWFIALLIINTMGVLEIIYLAFFQRKPEVKKASPTRGRAKRKRQSK